MNPQKLCSNSHQNHRFWSILVGIIENTRSLFFAPAEFDEKKDEDEYSGSGKDYSGGEEENKCKLDLMFFFAGPDADEAEV